MKMCAIFPLPSNTSHVTKYAKSAQERRSKAPLTFLITQSQNRSFAAVLFRRIATRTRKDPTTGQSKELFLGLQVAQKNSKRMRQIRLLIHARIAA